MSYSGAKGKPQPLSEHLKRWEEVKDARQRWNREAKIDQRFEAGKTWNAEELAIFDQQDRAASNYNLIRPLVRLVAGLEAQNRSDLKVLPRAPQDTDTATSLTKLLKYVSDQNHIPRHLSQAFQDALITGVGWLEVGYNPDPKREKVMAKRINPFDIWTDPAAKEWDFSDGLDLFRGVWMRPDDLGRLFPKYRKHIGYLLENASREALWHSADYTNFHGDRPNVFEFGVTGIGSGGYGNENGYTQDVDFGGIDRDRGMVRAVERWYRQQEWTTFARLQNGVVLENTEANRPLIAKALIEGQVHEITEAVTSRIRVATFVSDMLLQDAESPYPFDMFPFVPVLAYTDEAGVPMGLVRQVRDPQKEYNSRRTHLLKRALNRQVLFEADAFEDEDDALLELSRADGQVRLNPGALQAGKIQIRDDIQTAPIERELLEQAEKFITDRSGSTEELSGQESNAQSGKAIQARSAQAQTNLFSLFDNRNQAQIELGERLVALLQHCYTMEQAIRITEDNRGLEFLVINQQMPDGSVVNNITQGRYDVIISQQGFHPTEQLAQFESLMQAMGNGMPDQAKMLFLPDMVRLSNLPNAQQVADKLQMMVDMQLAPPPGAGPGPGAPGAGPPGPAGPGSPHGRTGPGAENPNPGPITQGPPGRPPGGPSA